MNLFKNCTRQSVKFAKNIICLFQLQKEKFRATLTLQISSQYLPESRREEMKISSFSPLFDSAQNWTRDLNKKR
jgi:hypothetical protein